MGVLGVVVAVGMSVTLLWAGLEKVRDGSSTSATLRELGLPASVASPVGQAVPPIEIGAAVAVLFWPGAFLVHASLVMLAVAFAAAGLVALRNETPIRCRCFGSGQVGVLGWRQVFVLVPWLGGVVLLGVAVPPRPALHFGVTALALVALAIGAARVPAVWSARREAVDDRRSASEMFAWLS